MHNEDDWHKRAVCPCGWHVYAPFASLFHVSRECCPECGADKNSKWLIRTMRAVRSGWFGTRWESKEPTP